MIQTAKRARPRSGTYVGCICVRVSTACTTSLNPACSGSAAKRTRARRAVRLFMAALLSLLLPRLADVRDAELPFERRELVEVDVSDEVDERQLTRLGVDDQQARHVLAAHVDIDIDVLFQLAADGDHRPPIRPELGAHLLDDAPVVLALTVVLVAVDVDAGERLDEVARLALVRIAVAEELRGEAEHRAVERDVGRFGGVLG